MPRLGPSLWDDPNYVLGTILPKYRSFDLGSPGLPFRNIYIEGAVIGGGDLINNADWLQWLNNVGVAVDVLRLNSSNTVELNAPTGEEIDLQINKLTGWKLSATRAWEQDATNGSDIVFNATVGLIRQGTTDAADNKSNVMVGGGARSAGRGAEVAVYGNEAGGGNAGFAYLDSGSATNANVRIRVLSAGGFVELYQNNLRGWYLNTTKDWINDGTTGGNVVFSIPTTGVQLQSGANGRTGTFTLNGATPVVVGNTSLTVGDQIIITRDVAAGTPGVFNLTARSNGTSFSVTGTALDTSAMRYTLVRIN